MKINDLVKKAIADEPELPGAMPDEMWEAIRNDRTACAEAMRIAVVQTKQGILNRWLALTAPANKDEVVV